MNELNTMEQFAIRVAAGVCGVTEDQAKEAYAGDPVAGIDPALIALIIEIVLALIENCPQRAGFMKYTKNPTRFMQIWFAFRVRRALRGTQFDANLVAGEMFTQSAAVGDAEREQIYEDATPDFSVI